jgi:hypothetical protein
MNAVKELLWHMIEQMSDTEARQLLEFAQHLQRRSDDSPTLKRLATDPTFKLPGDGVMAFRIVEAIQGKGIPASKLLVDNRR